MQKIVTFLWAWWSGKSTHAIHARDRFWLKKPINYTTRKKRNEKDIDYRHITITQFCKKWSEWELFNAINFDGNFYWFDNDHIIKTKQTILCITPQALNRIKEYTEKTQAKLLTVFFDAPENELSKRILKRGVSPEETKKRITTDQIEIKNRPATYDTIINTDKPLKDVRIDLMPILENFFNS